MSEPGDVALPISCSQCGKRGYEKLFRLEENPITICSRCGSQIDASEVLRDFRRHIEDLRSSSEHK
jgi:predicted nucleic acid-binding Zn ribbon protein